MSVQASRTILVIEDEPTQRILAKEYLELAGYSVRSSEDGKHGLNMAMKTQPDLIILDLMLPSIDGYSLCKSLKQSEKTAQIPIILVTASKEPDVIKRALAAGADDFVTKPVDWQFLEDRVSFVLARAEQKKTLDAQISSLRAEEKDKQQIETEQFAPRIEALQQALEAASTNLVKAQERSSQEIESLKAKSKEELEVVHSTAAEELANAQIQHTEDTERLTSEFTAEMDEQKRCFDAQLKSIEERQDFELTLANEVRDELSESCLGDLEQQQSFSSQEFSERIRAMWQIVRNSCENYDDILSTMMGQAKVRELTDTSEDRLASVIKHAEHLAHSVGRLKKLAIVMTEPENQTRGVFEINAFVSDLAGRLRQIAARKQITINVIELPDPTQVSADPHRIRYAMTLLSVSALRSTPASGVITIGASRGDNGDVRLSISDTGTGLSPDQIDIYENCLDKPMAMPCSDNADASLDIPIVTALVRQQDGQFEIDGQQDQGTSVSLILQAQLNEDSVESVPAMKPDQKMAS